MHHRRRRAHRRRVRPAHRSGADVRERRRGHHGGLRLRLGLRLRRAHRRRVRPAHRSGADVRERRRGHLGGLRLHRRRVRRRGHLGGLRLRLGLRLRRAPLLLRRCGGALRGVLRGALRRALRSCHDVTKDEFGSALGAIFAVVSFFQMKRGAHLLSGSSSPGSSRARGKRRPRPLPRSYARAAIAAGSGSVRLPSLVPVSLTHTGNPRSQNLARSPQRLRSVNLLS